LPISSAGGGSRRLRIIAAAIDLKHTLHFANLLEIQRHLLTSSIASGIICLYPHS
jgi:hypothetical protein